MKQIMLAGLFVAASYLVWEQFKPAPPPAPPPEIPAILSEPAPVIGEAEQAKILKSAEDPDPAVRWEAAMLLDKLGSPQAMPLLVLMLQKDLDPQLRAKIADLLGGRRSPESVKALVGALRDPDPHVRLAALRAIEKTGDYSVAGALAVGPVRDPEETVRLQALKTLNALQDRKQADIDAARRSYEQAKQAAESAHNR